MLLTPAQKQRIRDKGYVILPNLVPWPLVERALHAINQSLGEGMPPEDLATLRSQSYCPELKAAAAITDLFNATPVIPILESALGTGSVSPAPSGQIALRFPLPPREKPELHPHLDGVHSPTNGVPPGVIHNFTLLVCVLLSDVPQDYGGNFTVWPGTHHRFEAYFRTHGTDSLLTAVPPIELPEPYQIKGRAGDVVLCHYQVGHTAAPNFSPHIRYAIFFRVRHRDHEQHAREAMTDIWIDWPGLRDTVERARAE